MWQPSSPTVATDCCLHAPGDRTGSREPFVQQLDAQVARICGPGAIFRVMTKASAACAHLI